MGGGYFCFEEYALFSLNGYALRAPDPLIEKRFWDLFPPACLRYWPIFMFKFPQISTLLERTIPVNAITEVTRSGGFVTRIAFVQPWLRVEWMGAPWYVSEKGFMWSPSLWGLRPPRGAVWKLPDSFGRYSQPGKIENIPDGVFPAMFSVEMLKNFVNIFEGQTWFQNVSEVDVERQAGEYVLKLNVDFNGRKILLKAQGDIGKWRSIGAALPRVAPQATVVDMTYSNKLVVKRNAHEGSSK